MKPKAGANHRWKRVGSLSLCVLGIGAMGWAAIPTDSSSSHGKASSRTQALALLGPAEQPTAHPKIIKGFGTLPLSFEENQGQVDSQVKFLARGRGYTLFLTDTEAVLALRSGASEKVDAKDDQAKTVAKQEKSKVSRSADEPQAGDEGAKAALQGGGTADGLSSLPASSPSRLTPHENVIRMTFAGANQKPTVKGADTLPGIVNYFIGKDESKWRTNIPTYKKVQYDNLYEGIDLVYYGNQGKLEYDLVVAPGADPNQMQGDRGSLYERLQTEKV